MPTTSERGDGNLENKADFAQDFAQDLARLAPLLI